MTIVDKEKNHESMSKKKANRKTDLKRILDRNQNKTIKDAASVDMQPEEYKTTGEKPVEADVLSSSDNQVEQAKFAPAVNVERRENQPLSDEQRAKAIEAIKEYWPKMKNKQELVTVLNMALLVLYGENAKTLTLRTLNFYAYSSNNKKRYITFQIPKKKKGNFRTIDAPCAGLKMIQRALNLIFQTLYTPHQAAMGFVQHRSVVTNARLHVGQKYVYNIDLKDFFPSITSGRLFKRLQVPPFKMDKSMASIVTDLCCYTNAEGKNVLPQGAPTSPTITNFICEHLDHKLTRLANAYGMKYSRYADDITFSGMSNMFAEEGKFCKSLHHIIEEEEHLIINPDKTRLCHLGERQEVTGLTVNDHANVSKKYIRQLRSIIHLCEIKGLAKAQQIYEKNYIPKTTRPKAPIPHLENVIAGKLLYFKMVVGEHNDNYKRLNARLEALVESNHEKAMATHQQTTNVIPIATMEDTPSNEKEILYELMALNALLE